MAQPRRQEKRRAPPRREGGRRGRRRRAAARRCRQEGRAPKVKSWNLVESGGIWWNLVESGRLWRLEVELCVWRVRVDLRQGRVRYGTRSPHTQGGGARATCRPCASRSRPRRRRAHPAAAAPPRPSRRPAATSPGVQQEPMPGLVSFVAALVKQHCENLESGCEENDWTSRDGSQYWYQPV